MSEIIFEVNQLSTDWLKELSFTVERGDFVTIIGPSGAGKSSLLYLLNRLKDPKEGTIFYKGKNVTGYPVRELRKEVGMVFQQANLFPGTVEENILYGPILHKEALEGVAEELLEVVQLPKSYLQRDVDDLSGGEKQRVAFARTLANKPSVLLLDEPTSALDLRTIDAIEDFLVGLIEKEQKTLLMVTHNVEQAKRLGTKTIFMQGGKLIEMNDTHSLFTKPQTANLKEFLKGEGA
ncbi:phosphate ABC transporter ATP-binding protein [Bacillus tianshenii]|nr:phosphate ABC transporter ATP-binding protein [Bacillus tianshenii]